MIRFEPTPAPPSRLRNAYLDGLREPQGLYVEQLVASGRTWRYGDVAYVVEAEGKIVEFFVVPDQINRTVEIFDGAMSATNALGILCKSYDSQLLFVALSKPATVNPIGLLFRRISDTGFSPRDDMSFRAGDATDVERIFQFNDDFFESSDEIKAYVELGGLFLLEKQSEVVGCGIGRPVIQDRPDVDIGMLVAPQRRRNGYGSHIISFLKAHYLSKGMNPICGCSTDNIGSQRALGNAGFVSEHRLLEVVYV